MNKNKSLLPRIGMRKAKSLLAIVIGFLIWQAIRLVFPELEVHPVFIYIYGLLEIRGNSTETINAGKLRIKSTLVAIVVSLPLLTLRVHTHTRVMPEWILACADLIMVLIGTLLTLELGQRTNCGEMTGIATMVFIIMFVTYMDEQHYLFVLLRMLQTVIGVFVAWLVNVVLFPYGGKKPEVGDGSV